jgi:hypothetical protein
MRIIQNTSRIITPLLDASSSRLLITTLICKQKKRSYRIHVLRMMPWHSGHRVRLRCRRSLDRISVRVNGKKCLWIYCDVAVLKLNGMDLADKSTNVLIQLHNVKNRSDFLTTWLLPRKLVNASCQCEIYVCKHSTYRGLIVCKTVTLIKNAFW